MTVPDSDLLKRLIDVYGLSHVVRTVANICRDEADQLRYLWYDEPVAKLWDQAAASLERLPPFKV